MSDLVDQPRHQLADDQHRLSIACAVPLSKEMGREGSFVSPKFYEGKGLAVFTSGGDSQGMNSAIRAVIRMGIYLGCKVYVIHEGYQGMVDGGDNIKEADWNYASDIIQRGGTIIGSARCKDFRERAGRLKACKNLVQHNITNLVSIGGDGSLTGANTFRQEWPGLLKELVDTKVVSASKLKECPNINIVGLVGSIDNDFCGTDMTIGADSALHRIVEAVDAVAATAQSHQRAFIIEVMGRRCGYLGVVGALATEADWVFTPEWPPPLDWPEMLCNKLQKEREFGQRVNIILCCEGAINCNGEPITAEAVKQVIITRLNYDTRVTVLGHVQRGGSPSAFDRLLGCRMGAEAVLALMEATPSTEPCVISIDGNQMVRVSLMQCVELTKKVAKALDEKNFELGCKLRGLSFQRNLSTYKVLTKIEPGVEKDNLSGGQHFTLAIMNIGAPAGGMNAAVWSFVRMALYHNCKAVVIFDSFEGLCTGKFKQMTWQDVSGWVMEGGSNLGTRKEIPRDFSKAAEQLKKNNIQALLIVGGFEAYHSALSLFDAREEFPEFRIPICVIPATISNNVPGTGFSIGTDTALNEICTAIDKIKQSATGTRRRVFIIETMGGHCGYLATVAALASGADNAYIFEEKFTVDDIKDDVRVISQKMIKGRQRYLILRSEKASRNYTTDFITKLFSEEGAGLFETKVNVLGHVQQGGSPSPFDRILSIKMAARAVEWLVKMSKAAAEHAPSQVYVKDPSSCTILGLIDRLVTFTPVENVRNDTDFEHRLPKNQWWLKLRPLLRILAKHQSTYTPSAVTVEADVYENDASSE